MLSRTALGLILVLQVSLKMIEQSDFLLQLGRVVLEAVPFCQVFLGDSLDIVEVLFALSKHLGGIIEVDAVGSVVKQIANAVLRRIVNPLLHRDLLILQGYLLVFLILSLLEHSLAFHSLDLLWLHRRLETTPVPFSLHKPILASVLPQSILLACYQVIVGVQLPIVAQLLIRVLVRWELDQVARRSLNL